MKTRFGKQSEEGSTWSGTMLHVFYINLLHLGLYGKCNHPCFPDKEIMVPNIHEILLKLMRSFRIGVEKEPNVSEKTQTLFAVMCKDCLQEGPICPD